MGFFDFLKSYKKRYDAKKKTRSGKKKVKTSDKEGYNAGTAVKVSFDEDINRTVKRPPTSIVHRGNKYNFLAAYKYNAYAMERQYVLRDSNVDSILKKVNTPDGMLYCIYIRKSTVKETTSKPKKGHQLKNESSYFDIDYRKSTNKKELRIHIASK
jgi:hypothetical protein